MKDERLKLINKNEMVSVYKNEGMVKTCDFCNEIFKYRIDLSYGKNGSYSKFIDACEEHYKKIKDTI